MRLAHANWFLVITLIACIAAPDVILDRVDDPWGLGGPDDPRTDPVADYQHPPTPLPRLGDCYRLLWHHPALRRSTQPPDIRVLLARLGFVSGSRKTFRRTLYPRRSRYTGRPPLPLFDPARAI
ncbi:MAG TPA: hypothetical protein VEH53_00290 [archaeon]|nr:hypothetical protein [archaeon]